MNFISKKFKILAIHTMSNEVKLFTTTTTNLVLLTNKVACKQDAGRLILFLNCM